MNIIKNAVNKYLTSFSYFYKKLGYRIFIVITLNLIVGVLDGFGLVMFLPLLEMVSGAESSSSSLGNLQFVVDIVKLIGFDLNLVSILILMAVFFILKGIIVYIKGIYSAKTNYYYVTSMRIKLAEDMSQMSYKDFVLSDAGRIQNTLSGEVYRVTVAYVSYITTMQYLALTFVYMGFAFLMDPQFAILITIGGVLTNFIFKYLYKSTSRASIDLTSESNLNQSLILQFVSNFKYLKATGLIKKYNKKLIKSIVGVENNAYKMGQISSVISAIREPLMIVIVVIVILVQVKIFEGSLASVLISLLFFYKAMGTLMLMQTSYNSFLEVSGSLDNMKTFEDELSKAREIEGQDSIEHFNIKIELKNASFAYGSVRILKNISLGIHKNETVAFVGESGSGKSTLINIIAGLMPINEGDVYVDGINFKTLNKVSLQSRIGYITQEPVVFSDTIFNNVTFWDPINEENMARFNAALRKASIFDFVSDLELGMNAPLGNNGVNLSGGQRQRISIARELYKDVDILIMDEATSALDSETEKAIQSSIDNLKGQYTILMIAHRLATIKTADRIILLDKGEILDQGSYVELTNTSERFKKMVELQNV